MSFDIAMIYADIASTFAVTLMFIIIKTQNDQNKRILKIESDLYLNSGNPTSMPLTKQVFNLQQDVATIKDTCEKLHATMESINTKIYDYLASPKKTKKRR